MIRFRIASLSSFTTLFLVRRWLVFEYHLHRRFTSLVLVRSITSVASSALLLMAFWIDLSITIRVSSMPSSTVVRIFLNQKYLSLFYGVIVLTSSLQDTSHVNFVVVDGDVHCSCMIHRVLPESSSKLCLVRSRIPGITNFICIYVNYLSVPLQFT